MVLLSENTMVHTKILKKCVALLAVTKKEYIFAKYFKRWGAEPFGFNLKMFNNLGVYPLHLL